MGLGCVGTYREGQRVQKVETEPNEARKFRRLETTIVLIIKRDLVENLSNEAGSQVC